MGQPELAADARFATHDARGRNMELLDGMIAEWSGRFPADHLLALLEQAGVPAGRIYRAKDMFADSHFLAREAIVRREFPGIGEIPMQNVVPKLSMTPGSIRHAGPQLGEHTDEVLRHLLKLGEEEISALRVARVI